MSRERIRKGTLPPAQETIEKLEKIVNEGNYYGAQQMYKTFTARYVSAERYDEALDLLQSGACIQLENGQITCGSELAVMFVETLVKGKYPYNEDNVGNKIIPSQIKREFSKGYKVSVGLRNHAHLSITVALAPQLDFGDIQYLQYEIISVPQHLQHLEDDDDIQQLSHALGAAKTRVEGCSSFLKAAIRWSAEFGGPRSGSPEIHDMLGEYIYAESPDLDMAKVTFHFVRGNDPKKFASILVNFTGKCYPGEEDLAIARAVLMYLSLANLRDANSLMDEIKNQLESKNLEFPYSDLTQFIIYLLQTLERDAFPLFRMLRQKFRSSLEKEPAFDELLDVIAEKFYGVQRRNPMQGMFGDIFKMMGGEGI